MSYRAWNPYKNSYPRGSNWRRIALRLWLVQIVRDFARDRASVWYQEIREIMHGEGEMVLFWMGLGAVLAVLFCLAI
jgi:hypothetical protein